MLTVLVVVVGAHFVHSKGSNIEFVFQNMDFVMNKLIHLKAINNV